MHNEHKLAEKEALMRDTAWSGPSHYQIFLASCLIHSLSTVARIRNKPSLSFILHWYSHIELGLPLEEPGCNADKEFWGKNPYDPQEPQWRHDYWGDLSKMKDELRHEKDPHSA
jgi:hypothetical protein